MLSDEAVRRGEFSAVLYEVNGRVSHRRDYRMFLRGGLWPRDKECEARSNLAKSVFHLSLEQTGAGELKPYQPSV